MSDAVHTLPLLHGGQLRHIAAQYGVAAEELLDFSANINPDGPSPSVITAIQRALAEPATLIAYPDLELTQLKGAIANYAGVQMENIAIANGFVPLLDATLRALPIKRCLLPVPSFSEYRRTLESASVAVMPYRIAPEDSFSYRPDAILESLRGNECDAILLANPQNPSGAVCRAGRMGRLIEMAKEHDITVLLDEAFIDYCSAQSLVLQAAVQPNLIVFRSVTKFFAIPGLRVAYAVCAASNALMLNRSIAPWPITTLASQGVCAALLDGAYAERSRSANERRRLWLEEELNGLRIETYPSATNFLLLRFPVEIDVRVLWERMVVEEQIVLRSCANFEELTTGHLRVAVRSEQENERLIDGLKRVLLTWRRDSNQLIKYKIMS
jgi:threonine-phosphate decarboxylase